MRFWIAVPARHCIVAASLGAYLLTRRVRSVSALHRISLVWAAIVGLAAGVLCMSHTHIALMRVVVAPTMFMFAMPRRFR